MTDKAPISYRSPHPGSRASRIGELDRRAVDLLPMPACFIGFGGEVLHGNRLWLALTGHAGSVPEAGGLHAVLHPDDVFTVATDPASVRPELARECRVRQADGGWRWYVLNLRPYPVPSTVPSGSAATFLLCALDIHARKVQELVLEHSTRMQTDMLNVSLDCIKVITPYGQLVRMNAAGCRALGVPEDAHAGLEWLSLLPPEVRVPGRAALERARDGESARFPGCSLLPGDAPQYWDNMLTPLRNAQGEVSAILCVSRDVTRQREVEERLRLAALATNDAIWDWDIGRGQMVWNDALERYYGYPPESVQHDMAWWLARIHPDDRERVRQGLRDVVAGSGCEYAMEYRFARADGRYVDVYDRGHLSRDGHGNAIRVVGALLDQTERKAIERSFAATNKSLEASVVERTEELNRLWNTSPDVLVVIDFEGIVRRINPAVRSVLGLDIGEVLGHHVAEFVSPQEDSAAGSNLLHGLDLEVRNPVEIRHRHRDGSYRWIEWVAVRTRSAIYATGRHVTAEREAEATLKATEAELRQAQKMDAIGRLTGSVAHDFNNLLMVICTSVHILRMPAVDDRLRRRHLDAIADAAERARKLIAQLLAFARRSPLTPTLFDVGRNVANLRDMITTLVGPRISLELAGLERTCSIRADSNQFDTAIVNMVANAKDAMRAGGHLKISIGDAPEHRLPGIHAPAAGGFITVSVSDSGIGIAQEHQERIFEPFFTTKPPGHGTGLGLSQVFGFAKQSGGEVVVRSREGEGATFTLYLPRADTTPDA